MAVKVKRRVTYDPEMEVRKEIAGAMRPVIRAVVKAAKAFEGSTLKRRTGGTSKTIYGRVRPHRRSEGVRAYISAAGWINVWERGRKGAVIVPKEKKALSLAKGWLAKRVVIPPGHPRPVVQPAVDRRLNDIKAASAKGAADAAANLLSRTVTVTP